MPHPLSQHSKPLCCTAVLLPTITAAAATVVAAAGRAEGMKACADTVFDLCVALSQDGPPHRGSGTYGRCVRRTTL